VLTCLTRFAEGWACTLRDVRWSSICLRCAMSTSSGATDGFASGFTTRQVSSPLPMASSGERYTLTLLQDGW
jgi:hypothetical protein